MLNASLLGLIGWYTYRIYFMHCQCQWQLQVTHHLLAAYY